MRNHSVGTRVCISAIKIIKLASCIIADMKGVEVKAVLFDGGLALKNWEVPCESNLTDIIQTIKLVKKSLNDYLSQLIDSCVKDNIELLNASDQEEETESDSVSGFIKDIANDELFGCEKRKLNYLHQSKKIKK